MDTSPGHYRLVRSISPPCLGFFRIWEYSELVAILTGCIFRRGDYVTGLVGGKGG